MYHSTAQQYKFDVMANTHEAAAAASGATTLRERRYPRQLSEAWING